MARADNAIPAQPDGERQKPFSPFPDIFMHGGSVRTQLLAAFGCLRFHRKLQRERSNRSQGNQLVLLDLSKGPHKTDKDGNVIK